MLGVPSIQRKVDPDYKLGIVRYVLNSPEKTQTQIAREVGLVASTISKWVRQYKQHGERAFIDNIPLIPDKELRRREQERLASEKEE
ncbi:MAG: helix-turn-helix domain-containing protein [Bradyrhizobiaceae bacterium]|nr:helix-turn-helix domain-containing protein [Bradyrhizobiaceae bacterium]